MADKLLTAIAEMINIIPNDEYKYGGDVARQILAKITEAVKAAALTPGQMESHRTFGLPSDPIPMIHVEAIVQAMKQAILKVL